MKIEQLEVKVRCDAGLCKNYAKYVITDKGVMPGRKIYLCENCANEIYNALGKLFVPKSPENFIKKSRDYSAKTI